MDDASPARIELVAQALTWMSPDLAGLLARGLEVLQAGEQPGSVYLLAHAGREISNTVSISRWVAVRAHVLLSSAFADAQGSTQESCMAGEACWRVLCAGWVYAQKKIQSHIQRLRGLQTMCATVMVGPRSRGVYSWRN